MNSVPGGFGTLFGVGGGGPARPINTFSRWQYLGVVLVLALAALYAAPNLFPPDHAIQISAQSSDAQFDARIERLAVEALQAKGIAHAPPEFDGSQMLIRIDDPNEQLTAQTAVQDALLAIDGRYSVALNLAATTPPWLVAIGARPMAYGLDLSGGVHFLLEVATDQVVAERIEASADRIKDVLREARIRYGETRQEGTRLEIAFADAALRDRAREAAQEQFAEFQVRDDTLNGRPALELTMLPQAVRDIESYAIDQNLQSLRRRVNELGVSEPLVQRYGASRIVVDLPGVQDSARAKTIIGKVANLEFRMVAGSDATGATTETWPYEGRPVVLERRPIATGNSVTNARQDYDPDSNLPQVSITLDAEGGDAMHRATRDNIGRSMAILFKETVPVREVREVDGERVETVTSREEKRLISVATIQAALGNRFRITGLGLGEARDLALLLRAGALAAPMYIVEERTVGPTLGQENIERGVQSVIVGLVAVVLTMAAVYRLFGLFANLALTANLVIIVAVMSALGATLTLPGIAGIVLTLGMAVDANVLITSRIREELRTRTPQQAIDAGYDRAFTTILDSNLTTLFVALILLTIGSGPVRGFAVTLAIGLLTSMYSAIVISRAMVNLTYGGRNVTKLSI